MQEALRRRNKLLAQVVIRGLASRNMKGYYAATVEEAVQKALELIPEGSVVNMGGSTTVRESGLVEKLKEGNWTFIDRDEYPTRRPAHLKAYDADWYLASCNAMTRDGILVNIDGNGNRVSAISYGPHHVLFLVSLNKVCSSLETALDRAENTAAAVCAQKFDIQTPCKTTGFCSHCKAPETRCCQILITRYARHPERVHVILINDQLGF